MPSFDGAAREWPATHRDLIETAGVAALATVGPHGVPQVTAVRYELDDDGLLKLSLREDRQKFKNLMAHPKATLFLIDPADRQRTIEVRATVELSLADSRPNERQRRYTATLNPQRINLRTASGTTSM